MHPQNNFCYFTFPNLQFPNRTHENRIPYHPHPHLSPHPNRQRRDRQRQPSEGQQQPDPSRGRQPNRRKPQLNRGRVQERHPGQHERPLQNQQLANRRRWTSYRSQQTMIINRIHTTFYQNRNTRDQKCHQNHQSVFPFLNFTISCPESSNAPFSHSILKASACPCSKGTAAFAFYHSITDSPQGSFTMTTSNSEIKDDDPGPFLSVEYLCSHFSCPLFLGEILSLWLATSEYFVIVLQTVVTFEVPFHRSC